MKIIKKQQQLKPIFTILTIVVLLGVFFIFKNEPNVAIATWWNDSWSYRKALVINHAQVAGDLTNFPVLVSLTDTNLSGHAQEDGDDFDFFEKQKILSNSDKIFYVEPRGIEPLIPSANHGTPHQQVAPALTPQSIL